MARKINREWRAVEGYEGLYSVSNDGLVRRKDKEPLKLHLRGPYYKVALCKNGDKEQVSVHRLVLQTFKGVDPERPYVNHIDGVATNNHIDNLEWCTQSENCRHAQTVLNRWVDNRGERCGGSKLTESEVREIRAALDKGARHGKLAAQYSVSVSAISHIKCRTTWGHLT